MFKFFLEIFWEKFLFHFFFCFKSPQNLPVGIPPRLPASTTARVAPLTRLVPLAVLVWVPRRKPTNPPLPLLRCVQCEGNWKCSFLSVAFFCPKKKGAANKPPLPPLGYVQCEGNWKFSFLSVAFFCPKSIETCSGLDKILIFEFYLCIVSL